MTLHAQPGMLVGASSAHGHALHFAQKHKHCCQVAPLGIAAAASAPGALEPSASPSAAAVAHAVTQESARGRASSGAQASSSSQAAGGGGRGPGFGVAEGAGGRVSSEPQAGGSSQAAHGAGQGPGLEAAEGADAAGGAGGIMQRSAGVALTAHPVRCAGPCSDPESAVLRTCLGTIPLILTNGSSVAASRLQLGDQLISVQGMAMRQP